MFKITIDAARHYVAVSIEGMLQPADADRYIVEIRAEFLAKIGRSPYVMLIDTTRCDLQSQDVVARFRAHIDHFPKATRIALVNGHSLARMQLKRILDRPYARFFDTVEDALPWLLDQWPPRAEARRAG